MENEFFIVKIYFEMIETKPYSYCYKFNERLALEFLATSKPSPLKRVIMAKKGIALFEAKAVIPKWIKEALPEEFETEEIFEQIAKNIQHTYSRTNYRLLGKFEREAAILPEYRERYEIMDRFERQCKELEAQIREYENKLEAVKEDNEKIKKERDKQRILLEKEKKELEEYKSKNEYYRLVERENDSLHNENSKLIYENEGYLKEIQESKLQRKNAEDQVKAIKNELESQKDKQTWLSKLFMKK